MTLSRKEPVRYLDKQEAVRHLIHTAFRMIAMGEDPFATHLLVQSADKMLTDIAKKTDKKLQFDFEASIRPERRKEFYGVWRETYNYFKHADADHLERLEVHKIAAMNVMTLFIVIENYRAIYGAISGHMTLHVIFVQVYLPDVFIIAEDRAEVVRASLAGLRDMTPADCFSILLEHHELYTPTFQEEKLTDLADAVAFYGTSFSEMHSK